ncbi:RDD family protein [Salinibacter ruber]|uniref:RDD family protein n=1 Tax=Salinibacter ruber TaxID=146919 RepID=UPI003C6E24D1
MLAGWLYLAGFESSDYQATPGKLALGIKVSDLEERPVGLGRATGRHFGKILSTVVLFIGFIIAGMTEKKQALHDIMAGCLVINK